MSKLKQKIGKCEIEGCGETKSLHEHHIIERTELNTTNNEMNLCVLCPTHHDYVHKGLLKIIGVYPSTNPPMGRTVIYELEGKSNIPEITEAYFKPKNKSMKVK
jgi:hypothetical protein